MIKHLKKHIKKTLGILLSFGLVLNSLLVPHVAPRAHAAETISMVVESVSSFGATDSTNTTPGLRIMPHGSYGYNVDLINDSDTTQILGPKLVIEFDALSGTATDTAAQVCNYVVAARGTLRNTLSFSGAPSCFITLTGGTTFEYAGPADINAAETVYFQLSGVVAHYTAGGSHPNNVSVNGLFSGDQSLTTSGPVTRYVTTNNGQISGLVFYDNGTTTSPTQAENGVYDGASDHGASGITVSITDGVFSTSVLTTTFGDFAIDVPANDLASASASSVYTLSITLPSGYHYTTSPTSITNLRVAHNFINNGHQFGINNQTDLAILPITTTPVGISFVTNTSATFRYTIDNQSTVDAGDVEVAITAPTNATISGSPVASMGSYSAGTWTIPAFPAGNTATLDITYLMGATGGQSSRAEIMSMGIPEIPTTSPVSTTGDNDSIPGVLAFVSEDDMQDFSFNILAEPTISGVVFQDTNNNGVYNSEPGLVRTVNLYSDIGHSSLFATTTSASNGSYTFDSSNTIGNVVLNNGTQYYLEVVNAGGYTLTTSNANQTITATSNNVTAGAVGYFFPSTISGRVFDDADNDGVFNNAVDTNLSSVTVQLLNTSDSVLATTTSASVSGAYSFTDLVPGTYRVRFTPPSGSVATLQNVVGTESTDSDINTLNVTNDMVISFAQTLTDVDAGFFNDASISGNIFQDFNYNSLNDGEAGMNDVTVTLQEVNLGAEIGSVLLNDNSGNYQFTGLIPGNYQVQLTLPSGYALATYRIGVTNQANDSDFYPETNDSDPIELVSGQDVTNVNAGVINNMADLRVSKGVNEPSVDIGSQVTFTIGVENQGPATANGVVLSDLLPAGLTYISSAGDGSYDPLTGEWTVGSLLANEVAVLQVVVEVTDSGVHTNTLTVQHSDNPDFDTSDNTASAEVTGISPTPSVDISKSVSIAGGAESSSADEGPNVFPGQAVTYYIDVANTSSANVIGFVLEDSFPILLSSGWDCEYSIETNGFTDRDGSYEHTCVINDGFIESTSEIKPGEFLHIRLTGRVTPSSFNTFCNQAEITLDDVTPSESSTACFTTISPNADLALTKTVEPDQATIGEQVVYTLHVVNNGPNTSTGAVVTDVLPSGLEFVSSEGDGTYTANTGFWEIPNLLNGSGATLNITAEVTAAGVITNVATITTRLQPDDNTADNEDSVPITGVAPATSLAIQKSVQVGEGTESSDNTSGLTVARNEAITYFIDVQNNTSIPVINLAVNDVFPTGISATGWTCNYNVANSGTISDHSGSYSTSCTVQSDGHVAVPTTLATNALLHIKLTGKNTPATAGTYCNQALVVAQGLGTPVNDLACFTIAAQAPASLAITHGSNVATATPGGQVTYTITVTNNGGTAATNVVLRDNLGNELNNLVPSCVLSLSQVVINDGGTVSTTDPTTIEWAIGTLQPGASRTVSIIATIRSDLASSANCQTTAIVTADDLPNAQAEANIAVPVVVGTALLSVNKEAINADTVFEPGDNVQYRVTVTNSGDGVATALQVKDVLPANVSEWKNVQTTAGTVSGGAGLTVDNLTLAANSSVTITYTGQLKDSDDFSLRSWKLDSGAEKDDTDFYPEQVVRARLASSDSDEQSALGAMDQSSVSLGQGGSIILATSTKGKVLVDGDGDDFCLALGQNDTNNRYRVSVAQVNQSANYEKLRSNSKNCYDLSKADLPWIRYIKIEDQSTTIGGINLDAVCLLHVGGLLRNTVNVEQSNAVLTSDSQDVAVDFTDVFEDPISASACTPPKQAQVLAPLPPPPPAPVVIPTPVPLVLPKTGAETPIALAVISSLIVAGLWFYRKRSIN